MNEQAQGKLQLMLVIAFILGSILFSIILSATKSEPQNYQAVKRVLSVSTHTTHKTNYRIDFNTPGSIVSRSNISIVPQVSGRVKSINEQLFSGGTFKAGSVLFTIENEDFILDIERLSSAVANAKTQLTIEQAEADVALTEWQQFNPDKPPPALVARKPQLLAALSQLRAASAQLNKAKLNLKRTIYRLPFDGRVITSNLGKGQYLTAGQSYGDVFDLKNLEASASLQERQLNWLLDAKNPSITITAKNRGNTHQYDAFVKRGASSFDAGTRFATVNFGFKNIDSDILPGVFVDINIKGETLKNIVLMPASVLQKEGTIWRVNADNSLTPLQPNIVYSDGQHIAVAMLEENIQIVSSRLSGAAEGMLVEVNNVEVTP